MDLLSYPTLELMFFFKIDSWLPGAGFINSEFFIFIIYVSDSDLIWWIQFILKFKIKNVCCGQISFELAFKPIF